jgi:hypothetical protein
VTFPNGNVLAFPPIQKFEDRSAAIRVALNGATGIETSDFTISISAPELGLPGPLNVVSTHRLNYDENTGVSATETVESAKSPWTVVGAAPTLPNILQWQRRALSPTSHVWWGPDNNGQNDGQKPDLPDQQVLVSPSIHVGGAGFSISFRHRFSFEATGWDGGVIELSNDGGVTWTDIGSSAYNGSTNAVTAAPIGANRRAFVNRIAGWPDFTNVTLNLGTAFANKDVLVRFRIGADESTGAPGWEIDDIAFGGITNTPFAGLVANVGVCK